VEETLIGRMTGYEFDLPVLSSSYIRNTRLHRWVLSAPKKPESFQAFADRLLSALRFPTGEPHTVTETFRIHPPAEGLSVHAEKTGRDHHRDRR
jgi:hypothetical protein